MSLSDFWPGRFQGLPRLVAGCVAILLLSLSLNGALTLGAVRTVFHETAASSVRVVGHEWALRIQGALRFGKPISQFYGLEAMLDEIAGDLPRASLIAVTRADGTVIRAAGSDAAGGVSPEITSAVHDTVTAAVERVADAGKAADNRKQKGISAADRLMFAFPIASRDGSTAGALLIALPEQALAAALQPVQNASLRQLALVTTGGAIALVLGLGLLAPLRPGATPSPAAPLRPAGRGAGGHASPVFLAEHPDVPGSVPRPRARYGAAGRRSAGA